MSRRVLIRFCLMMIVSKLGRTCVLEKAGQPINSKVMRRRSAEYAGHAAVPPVSQCHGVVRYIHTSLKPSLHHM